MKYIVATVVDKTDMVTELVARSKPIIKNLFSKDQKFRYVTMAIMEDDTEALTLIHEVKFVKYATDQWELQRTVDRIKMTLESLRKDREEMADWDGI
jgi:hypothetical protein